MHVYLKTVVRRRVVLFICLSAAMALTVVLSAFCALSVYTLALGFAALRLLHAALTAHFTVILSDIVTAEDFKTALGLARFLIGVLTLGFLRLAGDGTFVEYRVINGTPFDDAHNVCASFDVTLDVRSKAPRALLAGSIKIQNDHIKSKCVMILS